MRKRVLSAGIMLWARGIALDQRYYPLLWRYYAFLVIPLGLSVDTTQLVLAAGRKSERAEGGNAGTRESGKATL